MLRIAAPLAAAHLAELAMFLTSKMIIGRLGYQSLAAVGLGSALTLELLAVLMGLLSVVAVLVAQAEGQSRKSAAGNATRQGMVVALLIAIPSTVGIWYLDRLLPLLGQEPVVVELAGPYLRALSFAVLPFLWFAVLRSFVSALARPAAVMVITVIAVGVNYALTLALVEGRLGLPTLGVAGAGWATAVVAWMMFFALLAYCYLTPALRGYGLFRGALRIDTAIWRELSRLGVPVGALVFLESAMFAVVTTLSGVLGADALAASEILMAWGAVSFVIALGLAEATMVRVAYNVGRENPTGARQAGFIGMAIGVLILGVLVIVPLAFPRALVDLFLEPSDPGYAEVSSIAISLFVVVALFQVFDGLQATAARALRAIKDTVAPLWIAAFGYWLVGIGGGWGLAFGLGLGVAGLWWGLAAGLIVTGILLAWRFASLTARPPA